MPSFDLADAIHVMALHESCLEWLKPVTIQSRSDKSIEMDAALAYLVENQPDGLLVEFQGRLLDLTGVW